MDRLTQCIDMGDSDFNKIAFKNPHDPEGLYNLRDIVLTLNDDELLPIAEKLAAYEDTGLTPDVCRNYKLFEDAAISNCVTFDRLVELMTAAAEGRLIALPCKVGDTVYQTNGVEIYKSKILNIIFDTDGIAFDKSAFGQSVFLTCEEAEAKMKEMQRKMWGINTHRFTNDFSDIGKTVFLNREDAEAAVKEGKS